MIAFLRPDAWDLPVFVHVLGAMLLTGCVAAGVAALAAARAGSAADAILVRVGAWSLTAAIPAWALMRGGAEWARSREPFPRDSEWIGVGYVVADGGAIVLLLAVALAWTAVRRRSTTAGRAAAVLAALLAVGYLVAVWAMTTKPS
jgi:phosphotransferase system  glucose/maltose/N-acetylglucosamine-specific IIC component